MHSQKTMRARTWLIAVVALTTLSTACAAQTDDGSSGAKSDVLGDTVKVGGLVTRTSAIGYTTAAAEIGAKARFERANAEGGVHGRTVDFTGAQDDAMNPATADAAVKELVQREEVFAIVPWVAFGAGAANAADEAGVSRWGWAVSSLWCGSKTAFGVSGCMQPPETTDPDRTWSRAVTAHLLAEELGGTDGTADGQTVWIQGFDNSESSEGVKSSVGLFDASGYRVVGSSSSIPSATPPQDWLPYVNKIMESDNGGPPDVVFSVMSGKTNLSMIGALRKAGYQGAIIDAASYDPNLLADPQAAQVLEGVYTVSQFAPFEADTPEMRTLMDDVRAIDPDHQFTQATALGYWSADVFLKALSDAGKDLTAESFLSAAGEMTYENPALGTLTFPLNSTEPTPCGSLVQVRQGEYVMAQPLKCFTK
ncbi:ABC transporter substrate-binding protein [Streptomyces sp. NPDC056716]|uniref:ABC transporter substrate-binding protein n=1 Tax=unclassified Streptomyces TaxID=2593676 RepID=UPI00367FEF3B